MPILRITSLVFVVALACVSAGAQNPGDAVLTVQSGSTTHILAVTPAGAVTTVVTMTGTKFPDAMTAATDNQGALFIDSSRVLKLHPGGVITTVSTLSLNFIRTPSMFVDQGGDLIILNAVAGGRGVYRMPGIGGPTTTVAGNANLGLSSPLAMIEDLQSGDILVFDFGRMLHRIHRTGKVTTYTFPIPQVMGKAVFLNAHANPISGLIDCAYLDFFLRVDPNTGAITTLARSGSTVTEFFGIDHDPYGGGYYLSVERNYNAFHIARWDIPKSTLVSVASLPAIASGQIVDLVTWGSRMLSAQTRPVTGRPYQVTLSIPSESGQLYAAAVSAGFRPGIPLGGGRRIPLNPDPLFHLSMNAPTVFSGFQGRLNAVGAGALTIHIPAVQPLVGLRFFLAAVTYDPTGIRVISEPRGITIE